MRLAVAYELLPRQPTSRARFVMEQFGVDDAQGPHVVVEGLEIDPRPGEVIVLTGPSGSGKSSLLRELAGRLAEGAAVVWPDRLPLPDVPLADALDLPPGEGLALLAACGLGEAQVLLRTPAELSDGQRCRFRLALALAALRARRGAEAGRPAWLAADEFTAVLDRTLARVLAFNVSRVARREGVGCLLATTHEDVVAELDPDWLVRCELDGRCRATRRLATRRLATRRLAAGPEGRRVGFFHELRVGEGRRSDWPAFARWHYRGRRLGVVRRVTLLWHGERAVGICVFAAPPAALRLRHEYFGWRPERAGSAGGGPSPRSRQLQELNRRLWLLARVVLHPSYRGAGLAAAFLRRSCETCPVPWIEALAVMGHVHPLFERAGFRRVGVVRADGRRTPGGHVRVFGRGRVNAETARKCLRAEPVYYVFDNRPGSRAEEARLLG